MSDVLRAFLSVIPSGQKTSSGWVNFNCPYCGDTRGRGGFLETETGGWRYRCFNGGCLFNTKTTGWEPGSDVGGRPKLLFQLLGGRVTDLPLSSVIGSSRTSELSARRRPNRHFPEVNLPEGSVSVLSLPESSPAVSYLLSRGEEIAGSWDYFWSPKHPDYLIVPFYHFGRVVGYTGRRVSGSGARFIGHSPPDYIFNQETMRSTDRSVIVLEGVFDAIAVDGVALRNSSITRGQEEILNECGSVPIVLPDWEEEGEAYVRSAAKNGWYVSLPDWDVGVKDAAQATQRYGKLYAVESIIAGATLDYDKALIATKLRGVRL